VLVVDRARFPSGTISTHFFRGEWCVAALDRLGILDEVLRTGAPPLVREFNVDTFDAPSRSIRRRMRARSVTASPSAG
jgi:hypothetical protein